MRFRSLQAEGRNHYANIEYYRRGRQMDRITLNGRSGYHINAFIKTTMVRAILPLLFIAVFLLAGSLAVQSAYASAADGAALTVKYEGEEVRSFTLQELEQIAMQEGDGSYSYSAWNTFPTFGRYDDIKGPTVRAVLEKAGVMSKVTDDATLLVSDGSYKVTFTGRQLFGEKRYYYPDGDKADPYYGTVPAASYEGAGEVEAVIATSKSEDYKMYIGQAAPNDENNPVFVKYLADGGYIDVSSKPAPKCTLPEPEYADGSYIAFGSSISLDKKTAHNEYIYYTTDGSEPGYGSTIYNFGDYQGLSLKPAAPDKEGWFELRVIVKGYGKQDSETGTYRYYAGPKIGTPKISVSAGKGKAALKWGKAANSEGYVVYRSLKKNSGFKKAGTVKSASTVKFTDKKLKKGKTYYYKVRAYRTADGKKFYGAYSAVKAAKIR